MELPQVYKDIIEQNSSAKYFSILPPSSVLAQAICAIANEKNGGNIFIGISEVGKNKKIVKGLSDDFNIAPILLKALNQVKPKPDCHSDYFTYQGKNIFSISVAPNGSPTVYNGIHYFLENGNIIERRLDLAIDIAPSPKYFRVAESIEKVTDKLNHATDAKTKVLAHYMSTLRLIDSVSSVLMPEGANKVTNNNDGSVLLRMLVCSIFDNLETYLGDLLFEIWLSNPNMLKSTGEVTVEEVLNCVDIEEFVRYYARKRISNMTKGSIKKFIKENPHISDLKVISVPDQKTIENLMQIRHLFTHRNGVVDDKFANRFPGVTVGTNYLLSVDQVLDHLEYLIGIIHQLDQAAISKYGLATT